MADAEANKLLILELSSYETGPIDWVRPRAFTNGKMTNFVFLIIAAALSSRAG